MQSHDEKAVKVLVNRIVKEKWSITVDWDEPTLLRAKEEMLASISATDEVWVNVYADRKLLGGLYLVFGNDPGELIADHTCNENMEKLYAAVQEVFYGQ